MALNRFSLILRNMGRKRLRSVLLVTSIAIAFFIFSVLASFETGFSGVQATSERLVVTNRTGSAQALPLRMLPQIAQIDGVGTVTHMARMRVTYGQPTNFMGANAVDPRSYAAFFADVYAFEETALAALESQRDGVIVGEALALREGWQVGQRIVLNAVSETTTAGGRDWPLTIVGVLAGKAPSADTNFVLLRYDYFNAGRAQNVDTVSSFGILPAQGARAADVIRDVDAQFANSAAPTRTQTESDYMKAFMTQFADISMIVQLVVGAAFVTILMIVANTMVFAVRERTREIGVMKVLGFSSGYILTSVLAETVTLFAFGLVFGLTAAAGTLMLLAGPLSAMVPGLSLGPDVMLTAAAMALGFALLTGGIPAINAMRVSTRAALKGA